MRSISFTEVTIWFSQGFWNNLNRQGVRTPLKARIENIIVTPGPSHRSDPWLGEAAVQDMRRPSLRESKVRVPKSLSLLLASPSTRAAFFLCCSAARHWRVRYEEYDEQRKPGAKSPRKVPT